MRPTPDSVEGLLADLESTNPPRCKDPNETIDQHMMYAGRVELIAELRTRYEWTVKDQRMESILKEM